MNIRNITKMHSALCTLHSALCTFVKGATLATVAVTMLASCSLIRFGKEQRAAYVRPDDIKTENLYGTELLEKNDNSLASLSWRELYTDPCLQALIEKAIANNTDIKVQEWAIEQARASRKASHKAFLPSLNFNPTVGYSYRTDDYIRGQFSYNIPLALDWEVDVFGGMHNQKEMAETAVTMEQDVQEAIKSRVIANVASLYYQLISFDQTKALAEEALAVWTEMTETSKSLMKNGSVDAISVAQFRGQYYECEASVKSLEYDIAQAELNICAILGETPHKIERGKLQNNITPEMLRTGLSAQLLANRPDVRQAERNLQYFYHNEKYARAQFYPKLVLSAGAAFDRNFVFNALAGITAPIFAKGKIREQHEIAKAQYEQAKLQFQQKLIDASSEVVLALTRCNTAHNTTLTRMQQIEEYRKAVEYSRIQLSNGGASYLDVLTAQSTLFAKMQQVIDERLTEMLGLVNLYLALGGGCK